MKKVFRMFGLTLCSILLSTGFAACGDDDDDEPGQGGKAAGTMIIDGNKSYNVGYGYYSFERDYVGGATRDVLALDFYSFNLMHATSISDASVFSVAVPCPDDWGEGTHYEYAPCDYNMYAVIGLSTTSNGYQFDESGYPEGDTSLTIDRNGDVYTINLTKVSVVGFDGDGDDPDDDVTNHTISFSFTGSLTYYGDSED